MTTYPHLTDAISKVRNPAAIVLWLAILWLKYKELIPEVRKQLEMATKEVTQSGGGDLDMYLHRTGVKLESSYHPSSADPAAVALRMEVYNLQQAKGPLSRFQA